MCQSISSASLREGVLVIKNVSVKLFSCFNGGSIGEPERLSQNLQFLQWREYWWSRSCLPNCLVSSMEGVLVIKNVTVKLFSFINGGSIGDEERVCQTLQLLQWKEYWWSRKCVSTSLASSMEGVLVIKNVSVKLFSFFNGGSIGDQVRVCHTLQLHQWRDYWWSRAYLSNYSAYLMEGVLVIKNVSFKLFSFINGISIGDQECVCQTLQLHHWKAYWWSSTCLSNSSAALLEVVLVITNGSVKQFSFFYRGSIGDKERVCQTHQLLQWREDWWSGTCLSNGTASSMEGVPVIKNVSVKLFSFFNGGRIGHQVRVCHTLQLHQWRDYWWSRAYLSNSSAYLMEGVLVIKNVSVNLFSLFIGGSIGDHERVCQTLQLLQWREYWW